MSKQFLWNKDTGELHDTYAQDSRCNLPTAREDDSNLHKMTFHEMLDWLWSEARADATPKPGTCFYCIGEPPEE